MSPLSDRQQQAGPGQLGEMRAGGLRRDPSRNGKFAGGQCADIEKRREHGGSHRFPDQRRDLGDERTRNHFLQYNTRSVATVGQTLRPRSKLSVQARQSDGNVDTSMRAASRTIPASRPAILGATIPPDAVLPRPGRAVTLGPAGTVAQAPSSRLQINRSEPVRTSLIATLRAPSPGSGPRDTRRAPTPRMATAPRPPSGASRHCAPSGWVRPA
jgi:hypothetical protein